MASFATLTNIVRGVVQDRDGDRYTARDLAEAFTMALGEVKRTRPDAFIGARRDASILVTEASLDGEFPLDELFISPVVNLTVGYLQLRDEQYVVDGQATGLLARGGALLSGG